MQKDSITVRFASVDDAEQLLRIYAPYVRNTAISFEYTVPAVEEFKERVRTVLQRYPYIVVERNRNIMGYAYASAFKSREAYCHSVEMTVYIEEKSRGIGLGRMLYSKMEQILSLQGVLNLNACIGATPRTNDAYLTDASASFHEHMGYRFVGRFSQCGYKFNQWYDMIWMEKLTGIHETNVPCFRSFPDLLSNSAIKLPVDLCSIA